MKMLDEKTLKLLSQTALFKTIDIEVLSGMMGCFRPSVKAYDKGQTLVVAGEPFTGIGIVLNGEVIIAKESLAGNRTIMSVLKAGDMFGEMVSFSPEKKWPATASAQTHCEVIYIAPETVLGMCQRVCDGHRIMIENLLRIMSKKALMLNKKLEYLSIRSLRGRLSAYLLEQHKRSGTLIFTLPMNRDELADFFNVARPSISRELSKMRDEGLIDYHKASFKLLDMDGLMSALL